MGLSCEWVNGLPEKVGCNFFAVKAITFRPVVRIVVRSEEFIDPRKMNGKVLVDPFLLRSMVPVMIPGHDQKLFEPFRIGTKIAMSPRRVKRNENQIRQNNRLRKSEHERNEDKSAHQRVVYKVGAGAGDPIERLRRVVNGMKTPKKRHFVQSQMNEILRHVCHHNGQEKLQ